MSCVTFVALRGATGYQLPGRGGRRSGGITPINNLCIFRWQLGNSWYTFPGIWFTLQTPGISRFYSTEYYYTLNRDVAIEIEVLLYTSLDYGNMLGKYKADRLGGYKLNFAQLHKKAWTVLIHFYLYTTVTIPLLVCALLESKYSLLDQLYKFFTTILAIIRNIVL